jgi:GGDEF domain-containing protein
VERESHLPDRIASSAARSVAFARVTTLAAGVVAATGLLDLITGSVNLSTGWTWVVIVLALTIAALPLVLGPRFHPAAGLAGCWIFAAITALQVATGEGVIMAVNNLVLYPMIACYLGWFYRPGIARVTVAALFAGSAAALGVSDYHSAFTTWANLALASSFSLEAALYLRARLDTQIESDPLTEALNRTGLARQLFRELAGVGRHGTPLVLAAIDLDGFKAINDRLGHAAGDLTLVSVVDHLRTSLRAQDSIARTGGDEFVVLLPQTSLEQADQIMARIQADAPAPWSYGLGLADPLDTQDTLMRRADEQLYAQKKQRTEVTSTD